MWDQTGDEYKKIQREGSAQASEAKKAAKPGCTGGWEDDKKSEARQVKGMKIQRHKQTNVFVFCFFFETCRWRNTARMRTPL